MRIKSPRKRYFPESPIRRTDVDTAKPSILRRAYNSIKSFFISFFSPSKKISDYKVETKSTSSKNKSLEEYNKQSIINYKSPEGKEFILDKINDKGISDKDLKEFLDGIPNTNAKKILFGVGTLELPDLYNEVKEKRPEFIMNEFKNLLTEKGFDAINNKNIIVKLVNNATAEQKEEMMNIIQEGLSPLESTRSTRNAALSELLSPNDFKKLLVSKNQIAPKEARTIRE